MAPKGMRLHRYYLTSQLHRYQFMPPTNKGAGNGCANRPARDSESNSREIGRTTFGLIRMFNLQAQHL